MSFIKSKSLTGPVKRSDPSKSGNKSSYMFSYLLEKKCKRHNSWKRKDWMLTFKINGASPRWGEVCREAKMFLGQTFTLQFVLRLLQCHGKKLGSRRRRRRRRRGRGKIEPRWFGTHHSRRCTVACVLTCGAQNTRHEMLSRILGHVICNLFNRLKICLMNCFRTTLMVASGKCRFYKISHELVNWSHSKQCAQ